MNVLVTGFPGTGKSAIARELKRRGHTTYDTETIPYLTHTEDRATGRHIHAPAGVPRGWYDTVGAQVWDEVRIRQLLGNSDDLFVCAFTHNLADFFDLFDYMFVLTLDDVELEQRLLERQGDTIGKTPDELADILLLHHQFETSMVRHGAQALNAHTATPELVDRILHCIGHSA